MKEKFLEDYFDRIVMVSLFLVTLLPLFFIPFIFFDMYELPKVTLFRLITLTILGAWGIKILYNKKLEFYRSSLDLPILFFLFFLFLSTLFSVNPLLSILGRYKRNEGLLTWTSYIIIYFAATNFLRKKQQVKRVLIFLAYSSILVSLYAIFQHFGWDFVQYSGKTSLSRSASTLGNPVFLGAYLTIIIPLALALFASKNIVSKKIVWGVVTVLASVSLIYSMGRAAWLGTLVALLLFGIFLPKENLKRRSWQWIILGGALILILIIVVIVPSPIPTSKLLAKRATSTLATGEGSVGTRIELWKNTTKLVVKRPFSGWGVENFEEPFAQYRSLKLLRMEDGWSVPDRPHNEILYLAFSLGLLGLATYFWIIFSFFVKSWLFFRKRDDIDWSSKIFLLGSTAAIIGYLIQAEFSFSLVAVTPLFWLLMGGAMVIMEVDEGEKKLIRKDIFTRETPLRILLGVFLVIILFLLAIFSLRFLVAEYYFYSGLGEPHQEGKIRNFEKAVALNPFQNPYRLKLGQTYYAKGTAEENRFWLNQAIDAYNKGLKVNPRDEDIYFNLGLAYSYYGERGDSRMLEEALNAYQKGVESDPNFYQAYWGLGFIFFQKGNFNKGIKYYQKAGKINPDDYKLQYDIGRAYEQMGEKEKAKQSYRAVLKLKPDFKPAQEALQNLEKEQ